jgi:HEAT repeat protein
VQKALGHREMRVRREAVQALGAIGGAKAFHLLIKALQDVDVRIRCAAALNLGKVGRKNSLPYLLEVIQAKEFTRKEAAEKKAFFDAIGLAGSNDPIPLLRKLLLKKAWFRRKKMDELRQGAASALALIASREAKEVLERGQESRNARIRKTCQQALRRQVPKEQRF